MSPFRTVNYVSGIGSSPARINRKTSDLYINTDKWNDIEPAHRVFILLHEKAHCTLDSSDEQAVDAQAFEWYQRLGYPLTEAVKSLTRILNSNNAGHIKRVQLQYERARRVDADVNENYSAKKIGMCDCNKDVKDNSLFSALANQDDTGSHLFNDYSGCQPNEKPKDCRKRIRVEGYAQARINKSMGKRYKGEAEATLAEQGIAKPKEGFGTQFGKVIGGLGKVVGDVGAKWKGTAGGDDAGAGAPTPAKSKMPLYIGLGVGGVVILGLILFLVMRKK